MSVDNELPNKETEKELTSRVALHTLHMSQWRKKHMEETYHIVSQNIDESKTWQVQGIWHSSSKFGEHEFVPNVLEKARPRKSQSFIRCQELEWKRKCTRTT